jgi:hypothetical protein
MTDNLANRKYKGFVADELRNLLGLPVQTESRAVQEQKVLYCPRVEIA